MTRTEEIERHLDEGRWKEAFQAAKELVARQPALPKAHAYLGLCYARFGELAKAAESLRTAFELQPHFWEAGIKLAECLDQLGRYEEALEVAQRTLKDRPSDEAVIGLVRGLQRQLPERITDGWQKSLTQSWWMIDLKGPEEET